MKKIYVLALMSKSLRIVQKSEIKSNKQNVYCIFIIAIIIIKYLQLDLLSFQLFFLKLIEPVYNLS